MNLQRLTLSVLILQLNIVFHFFFTKALLLYKIQIKSQRDWLSLSQTVLWMTSALIITHKMSCLQSTVSATELSCNSVTSQFCWISALSKLSESSFSDLKSLISSVQCTLKRTCLTYWDDKTDLKVTSFLWSVRSNCFIVSLT